MPDTRSHRGPHPDDARLFAAARLEALRAAVRDLSLLLSRGYAPVSSLKLVGDRYRLDRRQRLAVMRCSCGDAARRRRREHELPVSELGGAGLHVDGYNLLTTVEAALAGGLVLVGRDRCLRDLASVHGTWRRVEETAPALELVGATVADLGAAHVSWYLDRPVSNSGRLKRIVEDVAAGRGDAWEVRLVPDPDPILARAPGIVVTSDSVVLDSVPRWTNLARRVVADHVSSAWLIDLGDV